MFTDLLYFDSFKCICIGVSSPQLPYYCSRTDGQLSYEILNPLITTNVEEEEEEDEQRSLSLIKWKQLASDVDGESEVKQTTKHRCK